jgi:cupin 2 domain-containing protein
MNTNLFANLPTSLPDELFTTLLQAPGVRIERIVSQGHQSPEGFWYDEPSSEWVVVLNGAAKIEFEDGMVELGPGDFIDIPAQKKHRVAWTTVTGQTFRIFRTTVPLRRLDGRFAASPLLFVAGLFRLPWVEAEGICGASHIWFEDRLCLGADMDHAFLATPRVFVCLGPVLPDLGVRAIDIARPHAAQFARAGPGEPVEPCHVGDDFWEVGDGRFEHIVGNWFDGRQFGGCGAVGKQEIDGGEGVADGDWDEFLRCRLFEKPADGLHDAVAGDARSPLFDEEGPHRLEA